MRFQRLLERQAASNCYWTETDGAQVAIISGDPFKSGLYFVRSKLPAE
jgi:hypothetical protein